MKYNYSKVDTDNLKWFANDMSRASLSEIDLREGTLRGVNKFHIEFNYPISVIAGRNSSGKSTILALAACAFHNHKKGFHLPDRRLTYYTFSDFFIQTSEEIPPEGIEIFYRFRHDGWKISKRNQTKVGNLYQKRAKKKGGKWNNYANRIKRCVVFLGIQRVVPHSEKSVSRSYRTYFRSGSNDGWEDEVKKIVGKILGSKYDSFWLKSHSKYRMPIVASKGNVYSGFNMGAGENALFEIFTTIFASPQGSLFIVDEIELGLHEKAQKRLIQQLKIICKKRHIQVICTTHSPAIIDSVPPEGRYYIESYAKNTTITPGISSRYAAGKLSGEDSNELDIYVEDGIASTIIESTLNNELRGRVTIIPIGSSKAIASQMAAIYKRGNTTECLAILDGDQATLINNHISNFKKSLEANKNETLEESWFKTRLYFLPGETWPEKWLMEKIIELDIEDLADILKCSEDELYSFAEEAITDGKHNEIYSLSRNLSLDANYLVSTITNWLATEIETDFSELISGIKQHLD